LDQLCPHTLLSNRFVKSQPTLLAPRFLFQTKYLREIKDGRAIPVTGQSKCSRQQLPPKVRLLIPLHFELKNSKLHLLNNRGQCYYLAHELSHSSCLTSCISMGYFLVGLPKVITNMVQVLDNISLTTFDRCGAIFYSSSNR
jgi:hypothetical protein